MAWTTALAETYATHDPQLQRAAIDDRPAERVALWIETLISRLWDQHHPASAPDTAQAGLTSETGHAFAHPGASADIVASHPDPGAARGATETHSS